MGFFDQFYFSRVFKKVKGVPPSKYLATLEKEGPAAPQAHQPVTFPALFIRSRHAFLRKNQIVTLEIEALSNDGNGVAHKDGQAVLCR